MKKSEHNYRLSLFSFLFSLFLSTHFLIAQDSTVIHTWEMQEIILRTEKTYDNPYAEVTCWVNLKGPDFDRKVYGFWDGNNIFKVRLVATAPGNWQWTSGSNQKTDKGLNGQSGTFEAVEWTDQQKQANPNRHGFIRPTANGHALQYADGAPFFMVGDTWLAATTWRLPFRNAPTSTDYFPAPGIGFEDAVAYRKSQGFNSVSMIACFPNWEQDIHPSTYADSTGLYLRNAWEKFDYFVADGQMTAKNMRDEYGNRPFKMSEEHPGVADFDHIIPAYFQSLDKKMQYLSEQGFVPLLETVRRDMCPSWKAYFDFKVSYARYVQYIISRYGAYNFLFSGIHLDWIPKEYSLTADEFNEVLTYHLKTYGPLPFGQPHTTLINNSTYLQFGHGDECPWLTMHSVGNKPRDHRVSSAIDTLFNLEPAYPAINFEPYYTGWHHVINPPNQEHPPVNSERDNYFSRSQMYCSVLSGGLSGHVHGTSAYDITTTGEPDGMRHHIWDALKFESANYMQHLAAFILSEGTRYRDLQPAMTNINPQQAPGSQRMSLEGWSYMMQTADKGLALLYFENKAAPAQLKGFKANTKYDLQWYNPVTGQWHEGITLISNANGWMDMPSFPSDSSRTHLDWAAKIKASQ